MLEQKGRGLLKRGEGLLIEFKKCKSALSKEVYETVCAVFNRNHDGDFDITNNHNLVAALYLNKQTFYTENTIYPYCEFSDLRSDLIARARQLAVNQRHNHPWKELSDFDILKSAKLYSKDYQIKKEGFTLAAILLFGKDEVIRSVIPHHKTDLVLRRENLDRYDDRDDVRTNLIESYDRIIAFTQKHLSDPFYLEGTQRVSVRDKIFREVASNILIHREYLNAFPTKVIIEKDRVYSENGNKPHGYGPIDLENYSPFPKNPVIAGVFKEIGYADKLGSGIRNLKKYVKIYSNSAPELIEEDIFKIIIPLTLQATPQATPQAERVQKILEYCTIPKTRGEIQRFTKIKDREYFRKHILSPLIKQGLLKLTIPEKPNSPKQMYISVKI